MSLSVHDEKIAHSYKLSYKFQPADLRDYKFSSPHLSLKDSQPKSFTLRPKMAPILNQGNIGDCVCNAYALAIATMTLGSKTVNMSRLMNYAVARVITGGTVTNDSGLYVRDAAKCISNYGVCQETAWPYIEKNFSVLPPLSAFQSLKLFKSFTYTAVSQNLESLKSCLLSSYPIIFGFMVYTSFLTNAVAKSGIVPMPNTSKEKIEGGHCTNIIGYDDARQVFICANSWGTGWGDGGYFYMPYAYITNPNLASDFIYLTFTF
jgi:C1A family cysteine protease